MEQKLLELKAELAKGRRRLELLDRERQEVRDTLLRITGAIQVLEELSGQNGNAETPTAATELNPAR